MSVCHFDFFFFKQKTAYEMRISDWSSTCALPISRLIGHDRAAVGGAQDEGFDHAALARYRLDAEIAPAVPASGRRFLLAIDPSLACDQDVGEIGRASCRERVCQYV